MFENQNLDDQMEYAKSLMKLTPEQRKKELRRRTLQELRMVEMERITRVTDELKKERERREQQEERVRREREMYLEERRIQEAKLREEEERKANELKAEQEQLKQERLRWKKVMKVQEEPEYTSSAQEEEQQERLEKAGPSPLLKVRDRTRPDLLTWDLKTPEDRGRKETLYNNWVGEPEMDSSADGAKQDQLDSICLLFAAKEAPKSDETSDQQTSKPKVPKKWLPDALRPQFWTDKYRAHKEKKEEKKRKKAEEQRAGLSAYKASQAHIAFCQNSSVPS